MQQLHDMNTIEPVQFPSLEDKRDSLTYLMYLKKKRCGKIKGRGCADGRKQRNKNSKQEVSSPTVAIESVFLTSIVDAEEQREVAVVDIPGAYMHADVDEHIIVRFDRNMAEMLELIEPKIYKPYIQVDSTGKKVLYAKLKKALYGCLKSGLLFWRNLAELLQKTGFVLNPYDPCVANKTINGKQCTVIWHVDDLKISHSDPTVVADIIAILEKKYGKMSVSRGTTHEYLGMTLDFSKKGKVIIDMRNYVKRVLEASGNASLGYSGTPATSDLFKVDDKSTPLNEEEAQRFHTMTAKLLFLSKRSRPDILTSVAFLTTRVTKPTEEDNKKLDRTLRYLHLTSNMVLTLESEGKGIFYWRADGAFAVHDDMRSHTGACGTMGKGSFYSSSTRQKLNTKSSTEAELVAADDVLPQLLWTRNFMIGQGYGVENNILYQDNLSTMLLERNGKASSGKRTRAINIRYFYITDKIKSGILEVEHESTDDMVADFLSKPLQGSSFKKFRDNLLNVQPTPQ